MEIQKPSIGRIVHFYPAGAGTPGKLKPIPAVVKDIYEGQTEYGDFEKLLEVDLFVFMGSGASVSRIPYSPELKPGSWTWPPRE